LTEAIGLALPGNGSLLATHADREQLFLKAGRQIVEITRRYYEQDDDSVLPRSIASKAAFQNAMTMDIAMGGSTNTILHLLAAAQEGEVDFNLAEIDRLSRKVPQLCKVAPNSPKYHMEDVRSEEHTSELQSRENLVCRLLLEQKNAGPTSRFLASYVA